MIPGVDLYPTYTPTSVCEAFSCKWRGYADHGVRLDGMRPPGGNDPGRGSARREEHDRKMAETDAPPVCHKSMRLRRRAGPEVSGGVLYLRGSTCP